MWRIQFALLLKDILENVQLVIHRIMPEEKKFGALEAAEFGDAMGKEGSPEKDKLSYETFGRIDLALSFTVAKSRPSDSTKRGREESTFCDPHTPLGCSVRRYLGDFPLDSQRHA
ncbi:hypothetical protein HYPSUDRAFT_1103912 [Hypholoma sublateritium FD-334 SS-4]|uniref:Uncharacterized protein n=1 Tax=Hypholoma sublateritium (strain FD-334 SS-4) TaxID=945553 RepID=A0A0D2LGI3_HYPSF|nr:hypothetical protein HYPSUDRAFT_1103912 [Hypholoma sublateritium FD-334 SS-4]